MMFIRNFEPPKFMAKTAPVPAVSVIIVSHNSRDFLHATLTSLSTQTGLPFETIVVDNLSSDDTRAMLKREFPAVKLIPRETSVGFSSANNLGIKHAQADTLLFLNPDITFTTPTDLKQCYTRLTSDSSLACLGPKVILALTGAIDATSHRGFPTPWASFTHFTGLSRLAPSLPLFNHYSKNYLGYDTEHPIDAIGGMFMLVKREAGEAVGWWDEDYSFYGEDLDLCYRLWEKGYPVLYYPAVTIKHYKGATTGMSKASREVTTATLATTRQVRVWSVEAMSLFYHKHYEAKTPMLVNLLVKLGLKLMYVIRVKLA